MGIYGIKPAFQRRLAGVRDILVGRGVGADAVTWGAFVVSLLGGGVLLLSRRHAILLLAIPVLAVLRLAMNALDGMVASATKSARPVGELLNEVLDRLSDSAWYLGLVAYAGWTRVLAAIALMMLSSYIGVVSKAAGGKRIYTGIFGKADRMIYLSLAAVICYFTKPVAMLRFVEITAAGVAITSIQRLVAARRALTPSGDAA